MALAALTFVSCVDEEESNSLWYWGIVQEADGGIYDYKVLLDDQTILIPETSDVSYTGANDDRVKVYFEMKPGFSEGDDSIHVNVSYILVYDIKDILIDDGDGNFGSDPIGVIADQVYQSNNLLNVPHSLEVDYDQLVRPTHSVNLVYFPDSNATDPNGVYLELRHDANGDAPDMVLDGFFHSFNMESIIPFQNIKDSVPYTIVINSEGFKDAASVIEGCYYKPTLQ